MVSRILEEDGVKGLWQGMGLACMRVGLGVGLYFAVLGLMVETMRFAFASKESYTCGDGGSLKYSIQGGRGFGIVTFRYALDSYLKIE